MTDELDASRALAFAVGHVNVSMPNAMTDYDLLAALRADPVDPAWSAHLHAVLDETAIAILADLVRSGAVSHARLYDLAKRTLRPEHPTLLWLAARIHGSPPAVPAKALLCWRTLLAEAQSILEPATAVDVPDAEHPLWVVGGDVAIYHGLGHRAPRDLGVRILALPLRDLVPPKNPAAARLAHHFVREGSTLRIETATGVIAFHAVPLQTEPGFTWVALDGRTVAMATPEEVVVTALRFRSADLDPIDVVDLAALARINPDVSGFLAREVSDALPRVLVEVDRIAQYGTTDVTTDVHTACVLVRATIASALGLGGA